MFWRDIIYECSHNRRLPFEFHVLSITDRHCEYSKNITAEGQITTITIWIPDFSVSDFQMVVHKNGNSQYNNGNQAT